MNTKILVALVIGITLVGLTGAASACETTTSDLYYQFVHHIDGQGIDIVDLERIDSGAGWAIGGYCSEENAVIRNMLVDTTPVASNDYSGDGIYEATLTQIGSASITKGPVNSQDDVEELETYVFKSQDLFVSGQFDSYGAEFKDCASVGVNWHAPIRDTVSGCGNCHALEESAATTNVVANGDAKISEALMGTSSWTSLSADGWTGLVVMDGGGSAYSSFLGDSLVPEGSSITTSGNFETTHGWYAGCGARRLPGCPSP